MTGGGVWSFHVGAKINVSHPMTEKRLGRCSGGDGDWAENYFSLASWIVLEGKLGENHFAHERTDTTEVKAELIIQIGLKEIGWTEDNLREEKKGAPEKVQIAKRLRSETTLSLKRIAQRLNMGSWTSVSKLLYRATNDFTED
jgi:hypothetical protein